MINVYQVDKKMVQGEINQTFELTYYITEEILEQHRYPLYGIRIEKREASGMEVEESGAISYSREQVVAICERLARNTVTPMTLLEVLDDQLEMVG